MSNGLTKSDAQRHIKRTWRRYKEINRREKEDYEKNRILEELKKILGEKFDVEEYVDKSIKEMREVARKRKLHIDLEGFKVLEIKDYVYYILRDLYEIAGLTEKAKVAISRYESVKHDLPCPTCCKKEKEGYKIVGNYIGEGVYVCERCGLSYGLDNFGDKS